MDASPPAPFASGFHHSSVRGQPGAIAAGYDACNPTYIVPTLARNAMGAELMAPDAFNPLLNWTIHRDTSRVAVASSALAVVTYGQQSDDEKLMVHDQVVIDGCWQEAKGSDLTLPQVQVTIEACMELEAVYRYNWGTDPLPQTMGG